MEARELAQIDVIREGDRDGSRTVLKVAPQVGLPFHAVAVPQEWRSYTGPTWIYIIESEDGFTLIDAGSGVVVEHLTDAFHEIGIDETLIKRVIISHGHIDHDGGALSLARKWNIEVWAHLLWDSLRFYDRSDLEGESHALVREAIARDGDQSSLRLDKQRNQRRQRHAALRREVNVSRLIDHRDQALGLTFYHTPGHAADEITVAMGIVLFTGDHILPEITPHPTLKGRFPRSVQEKLPRGYRDADRLYGLEVYLRSLLMIAEMGDQAVVMPAHRLMNKGRLNVVTAARARSIVDHHAERIERILGIMRSATWSLAELTRALFAGRDLRNVYGGALSETMAHVELLVGSGDITEDLQNRFVWRGSQNYLIRFQ